MHAFHFFYLLCIVSPWDLCVRLAFEMHIAQNCLLKLDQRNDPFLASPQQQHQVNFFKGPTAS